MRSGVRTGSSRLGAEPATLPEPNRERALLTPLRRRIARWSLASTLVYALLWWSMLGLGSRLGHRVGGGAFGESLALLLCAGKFVVLALLVLDLGRVGLRVTSGQVSEVRAALAWAVAWILVLALLVVFRDSVAQLARSATSQFFTRGFQFAGEGLADNTDKHALLADWTASWDSGRIALRELALVPLWALGMLALSRTTGAALGVFAYGWTLLLTGAWTFGFRLIVADYDHWHLGALAGPVTLDLLVPFLVRPTESAVGSLLWLALVLVNRWILRSPN